MPGELAQQIRAEFLRSVLTAHFAANNGKAVTVHEKPRARGRVSRALSRALRDLDLRQKDDGAVELARHYASILDAEPKQTRYIGSPFLATLVELGLTPRAREAVIAGRKVGARQEEPEPFSRLDIFRAHHVLQRSRSCPQCGVSVRSREISAGVAA